LEIDPNPLSENVRCVSCGANWNIWDSKYYCTCSHIFEACQVKSAVDDVLNTCRLCAEELDLMQAAYFRRKQLSTESKRTYVEKFFKGLGFVAGILFEKLVDIVLRFSIGL
jgi:hypothetical protein